MQRGSINANVFSAGTVPGVQGVSQNMQTANHGGCITSWGHKHTRTNKQTNTNIMRFFK